MVTLPGKLSQHYNQGFVWATLSYCLDINGSQACWRSIVPSASKRSLSRYTFWGSIKLLGTENEVVFFLAGGWGTSAFWLLMKGRFQMRIQIQTPPKHCCLCTSSASVSTVSPPLSSDAAVTETMLKCCLLRQKSMSEYPSESYKRQFCFISLLLLWPCVWTRKHRWQDKSSERTLKENVTIKQKNNRKALYVIQSGKSCSHTYEGTRGFVSRLQWQRLGSCWVL